MQKVTLVDTSCLILLTKIGRLNLLKSLFGNIFITKEVAAEFGKSLPDWVTVVETPAEPYETLRTFLDSGEASVLAVARLADDPLLVIDEVKGRKVAIQLGIAITGTLGLIKIAIHKGLVENPDELVEQIRKTDFRLSEQLIDSLLPKQK